MIYSTGDITIEESTGNAQGAQMVVVEGKNSATVKSSTLQCTGVGNRNNVDKAGIMIYQSESGDADSGKGSFTASDSTMEIISSSSVYSSAPMFFVTNTEATITLSNVIFKYVDPTTVPTARPGVPFSADTRLTNSSGAPPGQGPGKRITGESV